MPGQSQPAGQYLFRHRSEYAGAEIIAPSVSISRPSFCYAPDIAAGKSRRDDESAFLRITKKLGLNPDTTPVSCPLASGGWGGAMGPSQFIPTTWEGLESSIMKAANSSTANPWNPEHAVIATSIYVGRLGAKAQTYTAERNAACSYYSGRACSGSNEFYGNSVMNIAAKLQKDIDFLKDN